LSIALPDAWSRDQGQDPDRQTWSVPDANERPGAAFGAASGDGSATLRAKLPQDATTRRVEVLEKAATWTQATKDGGVAALVTIDAPDATTPGAHFVARAPADLWPSHAEAFERVLRLLELAPTPVAPALPGEGAPDALTLTTWGGTVGGDRVEGRVVRGRRGVAGPRSPWADTSPPPRASRRPCCPPSARRRLVTTASSRGRTWSRAHGWWSFARPTPSSVARS